MAARAAEGPNGSVEGTAPGNASWLGGISGDAFRDLALLDSDQNGWIDEADPAWARLRLVQAAADASPDAGATLTAAGVGAIAVSSVATPFGSSVGNAPQLAAAGVYLKESGEVGEVQQLNFVA